MISIIHDFRIGARIGLAIFIPILGMLIFSFIGLNEKYSEAIRIADVERVASMAPTIGRAVHELQRERGLSAGYISSNGANQGDRLSSERREVDAKLSALTHEFENFPSGGRIVVETAIGNAKVKLTSIGEIRHNIDRMDTSAGNASQYFSETISSLLAIIDQMAMRETTQPLSKAIFAYTQVLYGKECAGQSRALGNAGFSMRSFDKTSHRRFIELIAQQNGYFQTFALYATEQEKSALQSVLADPISAEVERIQTIAMESPFTGSLGEVEALHWFDAITKKIDLLKGVEDMAAADLMIKANTAQNEARSVLYGYLAATLALLAATIGLAVSIALDISRPLGRVISSMNAISAGNYNHSVSNQDRSDEIGAMARAVEVFRCGLLRSEAQAQELDTYRLIIDTTTEAVEVIDRDGCYIYGNSAREKITGIPLEELKTMTIDQMIPSAARDRLVAIKEGIARGNSWRGLLPMRRANGEVFTTSSNIGVVTDEIGATRLVFNVFHDYTEELRRTHELEDARNTAEAANRAKSDFLSSMSHELRTPLNAILGFAQLLLMSRKEPISDKQREQVGHILSGGQHLLELINEVLDLAKIEAGKLSLSVENLPLSDLLDECSQLIAPEMERYQVTLNRCTCALGWQIRADRVRVKQVLLNLLSNAAKYNRPNGTVTMSCEAIDDGMIRLTIADTGRGIPQHHMGELFRPFSRLGVETTEIEGTGVGLALSKNLMESMGGRIGVESEEGSGSRFWLDFIAVAEPRLVEPPKVEPLLIAEMPEITMPKARLLYIEDSPANIKFMKEMIEQMDGIELIIARTAEDGLAMVTTVKPNIIIMDINLPGMTGIEAVRHLKADTNVAAIPVLALSADATKCSFDEGMAAGFYAYLNKPVNIFDLIHHINAALDTSHD